MWSSRRMQPRCSLPRSPPRSNWCARGSPKFIRRSHSRRSICAGASTRMPLCPRMTRQKTPEENPSMPSMAKTLAIVPKDETPPAAAARPEELRLLEALLFASSEPLDEATLARRLPDGVDLKDALARLQADYAARGVATAAGTLDVLLRTGWIRPRGRRKAPCRPITYGTTEDFLSHFGLEAVSDLPGLDELKGAGLLEGHLPPGFSVPMPSDDAALREDEDPLEPGDLDLGLAPQVEQSEK